MKAHKYWGMGSMACMIMCMVSGCNKKLRETHKYFAIGSLACMIMAMYSGYNMVGGRKKKISEED